MQVYLVGGAVRDELLGRAVNERDWVVVGATPQQMEQQGFRAVGRDFPVYLHPQTHEEYALARLERKVAPGYRGFTTQYSPEVTLEDDLRRRDLTLNAMARGSGGELIDPYGGRADLEQRVLRHVSAAFSEDPVRILRVARFAARFAALGFRVAPETMALMQAMVAAGEVHALVPERLWREMERALGEANPECFFVVLAQCGALPALMPQAVVDAQALHALIAATHLSTDTSVRFAALLSATPPEPIEAVCRALRVPTEYQELTLLAARLCHRVATAADVDATQLLSILEQIDAFRRPERFAKLLIVCEVRLHSSESAPRAPVSLSAGAERLQAAYQRAADVTLKPAELAGLKGPQIAALLRARRLEAVANAS